MLNETRQTLKTNIACFLSHGQNLDFQKEEEEDMKVEGASLGRER
jgi:hypothetical protein